MATKTLTVKIAVMDLPRLQVLAQLVEELGVCVQNFQGLAAYSVEYAAWPELQAQCAVGEALIDRMIAFATPEVPDAQS